MHEIVNKYYQFNQAKDKVKSHNNKSKTTTSQITQALSIQETFTFVIPSIHKLFAAYVVDMPPNPEETEKNTINTIWRI